ncbi:GPI mannosyltransferase 3 [Tanacetum coccineum]
MVAAAIACAIRPTSAIIWLYVGLMELFVSRDRLKFVFLEVIPIGSIVLGLTFLLDRWMYGSWILVPLNFLKFNFLSSGGDYYGTHPWHWYFTQGFTVMIFTFLPFMVVGIIQSKNWKLSGLILWVLALYSVLGHKEFSRLNSSGKKITENHKLHAHKRPGKIKGSCLVLACNKSSHGHIHEYGSSGTSTSSISIILAIIESVNKLDGMYSLPLLVQALSSCGKTGWRGTEDVMNYLAKEARHGNVKSILLLTPCHATPYYSTLHQNLPMRFLDCSPSYLRRLFWFMMDPIGFASEFAKNWSKPSHIILFESEEKHLKDFLLSQSFEEVQYILEVEAFF